ncbi:protein DEK-like [Artemia franciscana]|uniref:protein DEK-like n=1 Tax=Artemia franciscana TaxID=6661 RepID=UPI0032DB1941
MEKDVARGREAQAKAEVDESPAQAGPKRAKKEVFEEGRNQTKMEQYGKGETMARIPFVNFVINSEKKMDQLKLLHKILYSRLGGKKASQIKNSILQFDGYPFGEDSKEYKEKHNWISKHNLDVLNNITGLLGLKKGGTKEEVVDRMMSFLMAPEDHGKVPPTPGKRGRTPKKAKAKGGSSQDEAIDESQETPRRAEKRNTPVSKTSKSAAKKRKNEPPSNDELAATVKKLLDGANLEEFTMKSIVQKVLNAYPEHSLQNKKGFIKGVFKEVVSTLYSDSSSNYYTAESSPQWSFSPGRDIRRLLPQSSSSLQSIFSGSSSSYTTAASSPGEIRDRFVRKWREIQESEARKYIIIEHTEESSLKKNKKKKKKTGFFYFFFFFAKKNVRTLVVFLLPLAQSTMKIGILTFPGVKKKEIKICDDFRENRFSLPLP